MGLMKFRDMKTNDIIEDSDLFCDQLIQRYTETNPRVVSTIFKAIDESIYDACCKSLRQNNHSTEPPLSPKQELEINNTIRKTLENMASLFDPLVANLYTQRVTNFPTVQQLVKSKTYYNLTFLAFISPCTPKEFLIGLEYCGLSTNIDLGKEEINLQHLLKLTKDIFYIVYEAIKESLDGRLSTQEIGFYKNSKEKWEREKYIKHINYMWGKTSGLVVPESAERKRKPEDAFDKKLNCKKLSFNTAV